MVAEWDWVIFDIYIYIYINLLCVQPVGNGIEVRATMEFATYPKAATRGYNYHAIVVSVDGAADATRL